MPSIVATLDIYNLNVCWSFTELCQNDCVVLPKRFTTCKLRVSPHDQVEEKQKMTCGITQIPVVSSDAITGHKLQGLTKDNIIVYSWNKVTEWMYVVLSRVRTLNGLYLVRHLKLSDIVPPSRQYLSFIQRMKNMQTAELERFRDSSSEN